MTAFEAAAAALKLSLEAHPPRGMYNMCALQILALDTDVKSSSLFDVARSVGFTEDESCGIMDGWDHASGASPVWEHTMTRRGPEIGIEVEIDRVAYLRGRDLATQLYPNWSKSA